MSSRIRKDEFRALREQSRRHGRAAAERSPFGPQQPPEDSRPLTGLPMPRGLPVDVLTASEIAAVSEAWRAGYRQVMADREAAGEDESDEPLLWWSPTVPGGWEAGWRYQGPSAGGDAGALEEPSLSEDSPDAAVRHSAADGGAPPRQGVDWSRARVRRGSEADRAD